MPKNILKNYYLYLLGYRDALSIGKCFHYGEYVKKDIELARSYYLQAAQQGQSEAFEQLYVLATEQECLDEANYYLGRKFECLAQWRDALSCYQYSGNMGYALAFYRAGLLFKQDRLATSFAQIIKKDLVAELAWYRKAAAAYSKHALDALLILSAHEAKAALHLAQMYENGEIGNKKILSTAVEYYEKASKMGNSSASYRLGKLYEFGEEAFPRDRYKAFTYYYIAAQKKNKRALEGLERVINHLNDPNLTLQLAELYEQSFHQEESALKILKRLADLGHKMAGTRLLALVKKDANCAVKLAKYYEKKAKDKQKSYRYYIFAMQNHHSEAKDYLLSLAQSGDADAQYALGAFYYHPQRHFTESIRWCLLAAAQQHIKAIDYLNHTIFPSQYYIVLAKNYENGEKVSKNKEKALFFYEKAVTAKDKEAAFHVAQLIEQENPEKAFAYFLNAAQWGHLIALQSAERLAPELAPEQLLKLANVYRDPPFNNEYKAFYWSRHALSLSDEYSSLLFTNALKKLIADKNKVISFENLNLIYQEIANEPILLGTPSLMN